MLVSGNCNAQLTINIRYSAENGNARKYVEEMESSGIAAKIRAIEGCLRYDYFSVQFGGASRDSSAFGGM